MLRPVDIIVGKHPRPVVGTPYRIKHISFGTFTGMCVESYVGWASFRILDGSTELAACDIYPGHHIELTTDFYRAEEIQPSWNHQPE